LWRRWRRVRRQGDDWLRHVLHGELLLQFLPKRDLLQELLLQELLHDLLLDQLLLHQLLLKLLLHDLLLKLLLDELLLHLLRRLTERWFWAGGKPNCGPANCGKPN
jgi:hypothetical protein